MLNRIALLLLVIASACSGKSRLNRDFIDTYEHHNFREFFNKFIVIRSFERGSFTVFLSNSGDTINGPFVVRIDKDANVHEVSKNLLRDPSTVDSLEMVNLARQFVKYKVMRIHVDSNGTAFMNLRDNERDDLIKYSNEKYIQLYDSEYRNKRKIKGLWYEYIDD